MVSVAKIIVLKLGAGSIANGFPAVVAELFQGTEYRMQFRGSLPPAPDLAQLGQDWQALYAALVQRLPSRLEIISQSVTQVSELEFSRLHGQLIQQFQAWLDSDAFRPIDRKLRAQLNPEDEIQMLLESDDSHLCRLPWHQWSFLADYRLAEVALSWPERLTQAQGRWTKDGRVRLLAVLGNSWGIDVEADSEQLRSLPGIDLVLLKEPTYEQLHDQLWDSAGFDIFFFAGHSSTQAGQGQLQLNGSQSLTLAQLQNALSHAIEQGLQLAIFNSCDGLKLAHELAHYQLPHSIVMREPVPDLVAQAFLKGFLAHFSQGKSLYTSVRRAREQLQGLEHRFPAASGLPMLCQTPLSASLTWEQLRSKASLPSPHPSDREPQASAALAVTPRVAGAVSTALTPHDHAPAIALLLPSLLAAIAVVVLRSMGLLQPLELKALDHLTQQLPTEQADPRLLVVAIDERDIGPSGYGYPLSDQVLATLIDRLTRHQPSAIGLDIVRDQPVQPGHEQLKKQLQTHPSLVTPCALGETDNDSIAPPPASPEAQVGFVDLFDDASFSPRDYTIRRYLLSRSDNPIETNSSCVSSYSFGLQLVARYFERQGIPVSVVGDAWQLGSRIVTPLQRRSGGYQSLDDRGNQLLMQYRRTVDPTQLAQQVTLRDVLEGELNPDWVRDRVVLIGIVAASDRDVHDTPRGKLAGVYVHAHLVSQLLSAGVDQRRLLGWLPVWGDWTLILLGAVIGGGMGGLPPALQGRLLFGGGLLLVYGGSLLGIYLGLWLPGLPMGLALVGGYGGARLLRFLRVRSPKRTGSIHNHEAS